MTTSKIKLCAIALASVIAFVSQAHAAADDKVLAEVDGHKITQAMFDRYHHRRNLPKEMNPSQVKETLIKELIDRQLLVQDAEAKKLEKNAEIRAELQDQRLNFLASTMLKQTASGSNISDKKMKKAYDSFIKELGGVEYKASHILLSTEKEAKDVISQLSKGADFVKTAKEKSVGPSGKSGGDLGWFSPQQMVKPFSTAVAKLKKGEYTKAPVQTQFGWHVIKLEDTRPLPPPPFDEIKDQLKMRLQQQIIEAYLQDLRKKAKISIK